MNPLSRRKLLKHSLTSAFLLGASPSLWAKFQDPTSQQVREFWVSARGEAKSGCYFSSLTPQQHLQSAATHFRGHGGSQHPLRPTSAVMYARRHGTQAVEMNLTNGRIEAKFNALPNRYFFGHGTFSADGKVLFTTEFDQRTRQGVIGIRDALTYRQLGEYPAYGIEPHDLRLMPDGRTLVVANGGLMTKLTDDSDAARGKLNLDSMVTTLSYIDSHNGVLLDEFRLPEPKASIRHLDIAPDGTVVIAMQVQREAMHDQRIVPLGAVHSPGKTPKLIHTPELLIASMKDYVGNVVVHPETRVAGFTSPRGDLVGFWHIDTGEYQGFHRLNDVCGITVSHDQNWFIITNSFGELRHLNAHTLKEDTSKRFINRELQWDNHLFTATI